MRIMIAAAIMAAAIPFAYAQDHAGGAIKVAAEGGVLTDSKGMTLYTFDRDEAGTSNCYDTCATNWPPLTADAGAQPDGDFTLVERTDGSMQWAYKDKSLYLWTKDTKPGDVTGDGVNDVWHTAVE